MNMGAAVMCHFILGETRMNGTLPSSVVSTSVPDFPQAGRALRNYINTVATTLMSLCISTR